MSIEPLLPFEKSDLELFKPTAHARSSDPETSHLAAEQLTPERLKETQRDVYNMVLQLGGKATDEQLKDRLHWKYPTESTWRTRRCELVRLGFLEDSGERALNRNRREMIVWAAVR